MFEALRLPKTTTEGFRRYNLCSSETYSHLSMWYFLKCKFSWTFIPSLVRSGTQALCQLYHLYQLFSSMCVSIHLGLCIYCIYSSSPITSFIRGRCEPLRQSTWPRWLPTTNPQVVNLIRRMWMQHSFSYTTMSKNMQ